MEPSPLRINNVISNVYEMGDFVNAKKVITTKIKQQKPNPENLTLAERIVLNRRRGQPETRRDSASPSVDISDLTDPNDDRRTPTPEPTVNNRKSSVNESYVTSVDCGVSDRLFTSAKSLCDLDIEKFAFENTIAPKLQPAYGEPPFPLLQEANKLYISPSMSRPNSSVGFNDNKSDTEAELDIRRPITGGVRRRMRKLRRVSNPNEISLAQKLFLYKKVMAYKESSESHIDDLKRQDTRRTITSDSQPGPSNRQSATPPLPPIKTASPKQDSYRTPTRQSKQSKPESRRETPVLPPIARVDSRRDYSRVSVRSNDTVDDVRPPKDTREFDPNIGVGEESYRADTPPPPAKAEPQKSKTPEQLVREEKSSKQETRSKSTPVPVPIKSKSTTPKPPRQEPERKKTPIPKAEENHERESKVQETQPVIETRKEVTPETVTNIVPIVAAATTESQRPRSKSRSKSRSRSRSRKRSRTKSRSRSRSKSRRKRSKSRKRSRHRSPSSSSYSSRRRSRRSRSKSRKRHRSYSYSSDSSNSSRRKYSSSPGGRRHRRRGRSRSRRRSFEFDFHRAKSIVRSISRIGSLSRARHRSPSVEYKIVGGNGYWPTPRLESPRRKKKIIIVQNGQSLQQKHRNDSSSDSDISVVVKKPTKSKSRRKNGKIRKVSDSESDSDNSRSRSRSKQRKRNGKKISKKQKGRSKQKDISSDSEQSEKSTKKKNIRFDLKNVEQKKKSKSKKVQSDDGSEPDSDKQVPQLTANYDKNQQADDPVVETREDKRSAVRVQKTESPLPTPVSSRNQTPLVAKSPNTLFKSPTPRQNPNKDGPAKQKKTKNDENQLHAALEQLDKRTDFELEQLKGGNQRKLPPDVDLEMKKKIFSKEFQQNINQFLEN